MAAEATDPFATLLAWFREAQAQGVEAWDTVVLATVGGDHRPSCRAVIVRHLDERGLVFSTDGRSRKARDLAANPWAAATSVWPALGRQVRVEGPAGPVPDPEADALFAARPRDHQLAAWASTQSRTLHDDVDLDRQLAAVTGRFAGADVPRPPYWRSYRVVPRAVELWQGRADRRHERLLFERRDAFGPWSSRRLWP